MIGIDISHHNAKIDWAKVAAQKDPKIEYAFIKATEGVNYIDPTVTYNSFAARTAGIKIGYYHFASLNTHSVVADAKAEALHFADTVSKCAAPDLPMILDLETNKANLSDAEVLLWIKTFFAELEILGCPDYALYSYTPFLNASLPAGHGLNMRLWIAAYVNKPKPVLPNGWDKFWIWQYTAKGKVQGISGDVDMNRSAAALF